MKPHLPLLTASLALVLAACDNGPIDPPVDGPGTISFSYQGPISGTLAIEGDIRTDRPPLGQTAAYGQRYHNPQMIEARGAAVNGDMIDGITVRVPSHTTGSFNIDTSQCGWLDDSCAGIFLFLRLRNANGEQAKYSCTVQTGTIRLTAVSEARAKGVFQGSGECLDRDGGSPPIAISNGQFDVKLFPATRG